MIKCFIFIDINNYKNNYNIRVKIVIEQTFILLPTLFLLAAITIYQFTLMLKTIMKFFLSLNLL